MNLKCMINGVSYNVDFNPLLQGNTISEDYSETLDSGSIILSDIPKIVNLDPYDDVYIWDCDTMPEFTGITKNKVGNYVTADYSGFGFYKHFLVDRFTEQRNLIGRDENKVRYNNYEYKIELFSETKGLENVILPNIKITQPLDVTKRLTTLTYMLHYLELYSPKIKVQDGDNIDSWHYEQKYQLSTEMRDLFENHYCQEFYLNSPTLRELFSKLMVSKDCIPIVKDNVIYPLCLSKTRGEFVLPNDNKSFFTMQKTSDGYMTQTRTNYNNALSPNPTCHRVEQLGFRNSDEAVLTINNMRLETGFPIYKLNKVYMCYYKKCEAAYYDANQTEQIINAYFLCKQDITKLCVLNNERQALYKDTRVASADTDTTDFMKDNYYFSLGYSQGSNLITGFGEMFQYVEKGLGFTTYNKTECIIRNILNNMDALYPYGIDGKEAIREKIKEKMGSYPIYMTFTPSSATGFSLHKNNTRNGNIPSIFLDDELNWILNSTRDILNNFTDATAGPLQSVARLTNDTLIAAAKGVANLLSGDSLLIKGLNFEVDYEGFYNGAITTDKEVFKNKVMKMDNQSESMPYLDLDGIAREKKIQKMGNKSYTMTALYENWNEVQDIGTVYNLDKYDENQDDDEELIIYHRDISFYDNKYEVTYFAQESFVLKNFYTSVFAKHRLFNVLDYGSSLTRAENVKDIIFASKKKQYDIAPNFSYNSSNTSNFGLLDYLNFEKPTDETQIINAGVMTFPIQRNSMRNTSYLTDINTFTCGNSICFNVKMFDNITMGNNIDPLHLCGKVLGNITYSDDKNYRGTTQKLCTIYDEYNTGRVDTMTFKLATKIKEEELFMNMPDISFNFNNVQQTLNDNNYTKAKISDMLNISSSSIDYSPYSINSANLEIAKWQVKRLLYPYVSNVDPSFEVKNVFAKTIYKDANEIIDMTFQTQFMVDKKDKNDVMFSDLALKLSDLYGYIKSVDINTLPRDITFLPFQLKMQYGSEKEYKYVSLPCFGVKVPSAYIYNLTGKTLSVSFSFNTYSTKNDAYTPDFGVRIYKYSINVNSIKFVSDDTIRVNCNTSVSYMSGSNDYTIDRYSNFFYLKLMDKNYISDVNKGNYSYYTNIDFRIGDAEFSKYQPVLCNYSEMVNGRLEYLWYDSTNIKSPNDNNTLNTAFYGYLTASSTPQPSDVNQLDYFITIVEGDDYYSGYIYNYYKSGNSFDGTLSIGGTGGIASNLTELAEQSFQTYDSARDDFFAESLSVFEQINTSICYQWDIYSVLDNVPDIVVNYKLVCVGGVDKLETSIADKKVSEFTSSFGSILKDNNNQPYLCDAIFQLSQTNGQLGKIEVDLSKVPLEYQSVQEWIYNAEIKAYEFVCGFNISDDDRYETIDGERVLKQNPKITLYLSLVGNLDLQVYNNKGIIIGKVANKVLNPNNNIIRN